MLNKVKKESDSEGKFEKLPKTAGRDYKTGIRAAIFIYIYIYM